MRPIPSSWTIDPALETKGREALRVAQLALVQQYTPNLQTKAASPEDRSRRPVTWKQLEKFGTFLIEMVAKNVLPLREHRPLQEQIALLQERRPLREEVSAPRRACRNSKPRRRAREGVSIR